MDHFHRFLEAELRRLRRYARALTRNTVRADDLVQDSSPARYRNNIFGKPVQTCAHGCSRSCTTRMSMKCGARRGTRLRSISTNAPAPRSQSPIQRASRQLHELQRAIGRLPEEQRRVLLLVGLEGMSYKDAAAILGIPVGTIRSRLLRGRDLLRKLIGMEKPASTVGRPGLEATAQSAMAA